MKTSHLEKFAAAARTKLHAAVAARLRYALDEDDVYHRERATQVRALQARVDKVGREKTIEEAAYVWFNRFIALRFMDVNGYADVKAVSPFDEEKKEDILPELLQEAKRGNFDEDLRVDTTRLTQLLTGTLQSDDAQSEVYRALLIAECNRRHAQLPFLFQRLEDYTELLLPADLLSERSILHDLREGMTATDCENEEVIGWLYQFYIGEHNGKLIKSKKKYKADELAPASQLFTPRWIVEHMVDNTLGHVLEENYPDLKIREEMDYYIAPEQPFVKPDEPLSIEEITFYDPCVGSGHVLAYAFDLFHLAYERLGYSRSEIPGLILTKNLFGTDIDLRATQLASFALTMKARRVYRRFLSKGILPNIIAYRNVTVTEEDLNLLELPFVEPALKQDLDLQQHAAIYGSLLKLSSGADAGALLRTISKDDTSAGMFHQAGRDNLRTALTQMSYLGRKYTCVVTNPPYIAASRMEPSLKKYVAAHYAVAKSDLFAAFIPRCLELCEDRGFSGFMTPFVWMFISSYQKLREYLIGNHFFNTLIQLEYSGFDGATVPICTFTFRKGLQPGARGGYIRLSDFKGSKNQAPKTRAAVADPSVDYFYRARQEDFAKIPGGPVGYWLTPQFVNLFEDTDYVRSFLFSDGLTKTGKDARFVRKSWEVQEGDIKSEKFIRCVKGGDYRKFYGNLDNVISWTEKSRNHYSNDHVARITPEYLWKTPGITWTKISSKGTGFRLMESGFIAETGGPTLFLKQADDEEGLYAIIGYLNSTLSKAILELYSPTLNYQTSNVLDIPVPKSYRKYSTAAKRCLEITKLDFHSREESLHFSYGFIKTGKIEDSVTELTEKLSDIFLELHQLEEKNSFDVLIDMKLHSSVAYIIELADVMLLENELDRKALTKLNKKLKRDPTTGLVTNYDELQLPFKRDEILAQLLSYAVGNIMGRYSLDQDGLILANAGDTLTHYAERTGKEAQDWTFAPDEDGIVPVLAGDYFHDDIVGRCKEFIKAAFGPEHYAENLRFLEETIGRELRDYFVKDFYQDHVQRYKKRPIYWLFSSPGKSFQALVYLHRYTKDTVNLLLNDYLRPYVLKLEAELEAAERLALNDAASGGDRAAARKTIAANRKAIADCKAYERDTLYPLAQRRLPLDLDDGVLVNYNKMGEAVLEIKGVNDKAKRKKVMAFDWVEFDWEG